MTRIMPRSSWIGLALVVGFPVINTIGRLFGAPNPGWTLFTVSVQLIGVAVITRTAYRLDREEARRSEGESDSRHTTASDET